MSWISLGALTSFVMGISAFYAEPKHEWSSGKIIRERLWALTSILAGGWYLLTHGVQP